MEKYYIIAIAGKEVFLESDMKTGKFKWTNKRNNAIWFQTETEAEDFGCKYFTHFNKWTTTPLVYDWEKKAVTV